MRRSHLPHVANSFVGRTREVAHVVQVLRSPNARLLTLHGPGGVGKSRLALEAAHHLFATNETLDGAHLVALEEVGEPRLVPSAVADVLGVPLAPQVPEDQQVIAAIGDRSLLLLLDNVEHLAHDPSLCANLLRECPNMRLLVTSRQCLHLPEEHVLPLQGLSTRGDDGMSEAMQLLLDRMRQALPHHALDLEDDLAAHEVCELLEGFPLGLELAASWARTLVLPVIAAELRKDLDLLESRDPTASDRHRSLRASFELSWRLLGHEERAALRRAAVFRAGFTRAAAEAVLDVDLAILARLVDAALLRTTAGGRFERHPLVHQYTREKLAEYPDEECAYRARHAAYFLATAARMGDAGMGGADVKGAWAWFDGELANVQAAWRHAVDVAPPEGIALADVGWYLSHYGEQTGRFREVRDLFRLGVRGRDDLLDGHLLADAAWQSMRLGEHAAAEAEANRALDLLAPYEPQACWRVQWTAQEALMGVALTSGAFERGLHHAHEAARAAQEEIERHPAGTGPKDPEIALGISYTAVGWANNFQGRYAEALAGAHAAAELTDRHGSGGLVFALSLRGQVELYSGDLASARASLADALALARRSGFESQEAQILCDLAQTQHALGDLAAAEASCRSGLAITTRNGNRWHDTLLHSTLGRILLTAGRTREALASFTGAARSGLAGGVAAYAAEALLGLAQHEAEAGRREAAAALLGSVACEPSAPAIAKSLARMLADTLGIEPAREPQPMMVHLTRLAERAGIHSRT